SILPVFSELNKQLQGEEPQIHCLRQGLSDFLQKLLGRCMLATSYKDKDLDDRASMNFENEDLFLSPKDVMIGFTTRTTMQKHNLLPEEEKKLAQDCRKFMTASLQYACKNFPLKDPLLKHAEFLNFHERANQTFDSVQFFISKFPTLEAAMEGKMDALYDEFWCPSTLSHTLLMVSNHPITHPTHGVHPPYHTPYSWCPSTLSHTLLMVSIHPITPYPWCPSTLSHPTHGAKPPYHTPYSWCPTTLSHNPTNTIDYSECIGRYFK
ncbi:predicted protein, partial [Nematostella vectensis]